MVSCAFENILRQGSVHILHHHFDLYFFFFYTSFFFRKGSVIADFVVQTQQIIVEEMADANQKLPEAMSSIAPVIGTVTAIYKSKLIK